MMSYAQLFLAVAPVMALIGLGLLLRRALDGLDRQDLADGRGRRVAAVMPADDPQRGPRTAPVTVVVFSDFHCGYCKRLEKDIQQLKDVTVYTFLIPILGGDSPDKTRAIWCAKDGSSAWLAWRIH